MLLLSEDEATVVDDALPDSVRPWYHRPNRIDKKVTATQVVPQTNGVTCGVIRRLSAAYSSGLTATTAPVVVEVLLFCASSRCLVAFGE